MFDPKSFAEVAKRAGQQASITMVCFNRWELTQQSLASILEHTHLPHTLTVVDNASWDGTQDHLKDLRREGKIDRLILLPENRGIAVGKNFGLRATEGQAAWYCCIDNDIEVTPYWLSYLCFASTLPGLGIVGSNVQRFGLPGGLNWYSITQWKTVEGVVLDNCPNPGGLYVMSAATFKKLGYFCERSLYGLEDSEFHSRQRFHNLRSTYVRNAPCVELHTKVKFLMKDGLSYRDFKNRTHSATVEKIKGQAERGQHEPLTHYETKITPQEVEEYTWLPTVTSILEGT